MADDEIKAWCSERGMTFVRWIDQSAGTFEATNNEPYPTGGMTIELREPIPFFPDASPQPCEELTIEEIRKRYPDKD